MSSEKQAMMSPGPPPEYNQVTGGYAPPPGGQYPGQEQYPPPQPGQYPPGGYQPPPGQYPPPGTYPAGQPPPGQYAQQPYQPTTVVMAQPVIQGGVVVGTRPPDYLIPSILACICCFWPTGLCAIYYACRANTLVSENNMPEAARHSNNARNFMITSIVIGVIWIAVVIILRVIVYSQVASSSSYDY